MNDREDFADASDPVRLRLFGAIRRMTITLATKVLWQLVGFTLDGTDEVMKADVFSGIGFYARPKAGKKLEAIVLMVGADAATPVIVATRDEATRAAVEAAIGGFKDDETGSFNSKSILLHKADGTIEARSVGGVAVSLATKADVTALANFVQGLLVGGSGSVVVPPGTVPQPAGTTKLKGE